MAATNTSALDDKPSFVQLKKHLGSNRFLRWWLGELSTMVPAMLRPAGLGTESFILVRLEQGSAVFRFFDNGNIQDAGGVTLQTLDAAAQRLAFIAALEKVRNGRRDVVLALPANRVLHKILTLPLATEENLRQVLEFQMDEYTPFSLSQVYFGHHIGGRDFARGRLAVEFVATPRDAVDETVQRLTDWGCVVRAVVSEDMLAAGTIVNLLPSAQGKPPSLLMQGLNPWLAALVVLLTTAATAMPLVIKREVVVQMMPWLEKGKTAAEAADALRRDLETRVAEHNYLLEKRQALPPISVALEELTRVLPDDTWVQQLDVKGKELQIQGETASSVKLIGLFEQSGRFYDASFRSPLTKGQTAGTERYQLALQMRPMAASPVDIVVPGVQPSAGTATSGVPLTTRPPVTAVTLPSVPAVVRQPAIGEKP